MSFEERLEALSIQEIGREIARKRQAGIDLSIQKRLEQLGREENEEELERLEELVTDRIWPIFESAQRAYLGEGGFLSQEEKVTATPVAVALNLQWGYNPRVVGRYDNKLSVTLNSDLIVEVRGAGRESPIIEFNLKEGDLQEQLEDGITSVLGTPDACFQSY